MRRLDQFVESTGESDAVPAILFVVSEAQDPERLLADALRAQARSVPPAASSGTTPSPHPHNPVPSGDVTPILGLGPTPQIQDPAGGATAGPGPGLSPQTSLSSGGVTPVPRLAVSPQTFPTPEMLSRYGLLSGAAPGSLERERAALGTPGGISAAPAKRTSMSVHWILLLAVLLGLATGAVVGIVTLLWPA